MAAMEELETLLQSLQTLKPPGVTKTKIESITALCIQNTQSGNSIVQKIFTQFQKSPPTHKLGVLYVVDSVTRQWAEQARQAGQVVASGPAADGTYASGVQRMTELLPVIMNELIQSAPENQREKISKLLDIWERGQTFPAAMLARFKQKLANPQSSSQSFTPPGSPPAGAVAPLPSATQAPAQPMPLPVPAAPAAPDAGALLAALANLGTQTATRPPQANGMANGKPSYPPQQTVAPPSQPYAFPPNPPVVPGNSQTAASAPPSGGNELIGQIFQAIQSGLIPLDQAGPIFAAIAASQASGLPIPPPPVPPQFANNNPPVQQNGREADQHEQNGSRYRGRSRSPDYRRRHASPSRRSPPNRRDSPTYGAYDPHAGPEGNSSGRQEHDRPRGRGRGRGHRNEYRQRTPPPQRRQPSPVASAPRGMQPKFVEYDKNLPRDHIRVLSRTLFVGGASASEGELRSIFSRFGKVQTCVVNNEKRHAFVKMINRQDAVAAKEGMERAQSPELVAKARQTRWGVGFGPRECCDYTTGISVIPISRLTEADLKWAVTAEYGGTGGRELEGGMVIEEPDIEIGAGVSSKAMSRRPDFGRGRGGNIGPRGGFDAGHGRFRKPDRGPEPRQQEPRHSSPRPEAAIGVPPPVPGFGFQLPGMH